MGTVIWLDEEEYRMLKNIRSNIVWYDEQPSNKELIEGKKKEKNLFRRILNENSFGY